jgi:hypothetical protein
MMMGVSILGMMVPGHYLQRVRIDLKNEVISKFIYGELISD